LSGLQDDAAAGGGNAHCPPTGRAAGREVPRLRGWPGEETRAVRRVHRLLWVSEVQVHAADHPGNQVPEVQGRRICETREHGQRRAWTDARVLWLLAISGL